MSMMAFLQSTLFLAASLRLGAGLRMNGEETRSTPKDKALSHRYLFVAGPVGTGHEFFLPVFRECVDQQLCATRDITFLTANRYQQDSVSDTEKQWGKKRPTSGKLINLNLVTTNQNRLPEAWFMRAYEAKTTDPNVAVLAKVAKTYGDTLKVLVLTRGNERDLLASLARDLPSEEAEDVGVRAIRKLTGQVRELPEGSYRCQRFEDLADLGMHFGQPLFHMRNHDAASYVLHAFGDAMKSNEGCKPYRKCPEAPKLREALDELESLCKPEDLAPGKNATGDAPWAQQAFYDAKARWLVE
mmetsp:Transcript_150332/g.418883  ORF Transcript_150332/g.418883 Transcript_150332/m.418883 type:complete len:300 (-) Transcript_150332:83-982(-)